MTTISNHDTPAEALYLSHEALAQSAALTAFRVGADAVGAATAIGDQYAVAARALGSDAEDDVVVYRATIIENALDALLLHLLLHRRGV